MQYQQARRIPVPLTTSKAFHRPTGAHAIIVSLVLADLAGMLFWLAVGVLIEPLVWWLMQEFVFLLHASLLLDVWIVLTLACCASGILRQDILNKKEEEVWGCAGSLIILLITTFLLLFFLKPSWLTIPAPAIPVTQPPSFPWPLRFSMVGAAITTGLFVLAHFIIIRRAHQEAADQLLSLSRAHPHGPLWSLLEQAYRLYQRGLARFDKPPVKRLKTPPTFFYYPKASEPDRHANPEQDLYWVNRELIICQAHLGPQPEQAEIWLPFVARLLHDYNSPVTLVERFFRLAHLTKSSHWGTFLWLPTAVACSCERRWQAMERDRVLDRDRFAWLCGEGTRLRKLLRHQLEDLHKTSQPDNTIPTLSERIDHLDSLLRLEARQVKELRASLPPASSAPSSSS
jgi:hypothetical protein